jgi:hypothetical protein
MELNIRELEIENLISSSKKINYYFIDGGVSYCDDVLLTLDKKYILYHKKHPPFPLCIFPIKEEPPKFNDIVFYNECLAYVHDVPFMFDSLIETTTTPYASYSEILSNIFDIKFGNSYTCIPFVWERDYRKNIELETKYRNIFEEIQLYSMALKQADPLMEFLCYYRIIESISGDHGKTWIENNLDEALKFNYGFLEIISNTCLSQDKQNTNKINLFSIYKRKARSRVKELRANANNKPIKEHLYSIRCGIAHGKRDVIHYDYDKNLKDVSKDVFIVKLLARYGIEKKNAA